MLEIILLLLSLGVLCAASYFDLKTREIPDLLSYGFLFAAIGIRIIFSVESGFYVLIEGLLGLGLALSIGFLLYLTHQWGGGDAKLLFGLGVVFGVSLPFNWSSLGFVLYILLVFLVGAVYGLIWMIVLSFRSAHFWREFRKVLLNQNKIHYTLVGVFIISLILTLWNILFIILGIFPILIFYLLIFVQHVEKTCFVKSVSPLRVTEGDWMVGKVYVGSRVVLDKRTLELEDVRLLQRLHAEGKLNEVTIKEGIPFAPSFLIGFLIFQAALLWLLGYQQWALLVLFG